MNPFWKQTETLAAKATFAAQTDATHVAGAPSLSSQTSDPRQFLASTRLGRFLVLAAHVSLILPVFSIFVHLSALVFGAFRVHYKTHFQEI
jgi:hypothetical protein